MGGTTVFLIGDHRSDVLINWLIQLITLLLWQSQATAFCCQVI